MARALDFAPQVHDSLFVSGGSHRIYRPVYEFHKGPIRVAVLDPSLLPVAEMVVALNGVNDEDGWRMYPMGGTDTVYSETAIAIGNEQLIPQWGLMVQVKQALPYMEEPCDFVLECSVDNGGSPWLTWLEDTDLDHYSNWIRSGSLVSETDSDYGDPAECFEQILDGTWAPYKLTAHKPTTLTPSWDKFKALNNLDHLASVDIVITANQSRWTRCPVLETGHVQELNFGQARRFDLRKSPSVNQQGQPDGTGTLGMGWFPGYAVNLETGERLNMAFGENSALTQYGGSDMIWNPDSIVDNGPDAPVMGGGQFIYVFGHNGDNPATDMPHYDQGAFAFNRLSSSEYTPSDAEKRRVFQSAMWVSIPLLRQGHSWMESDVMIRLRVRKPFKQYATLTTLVNGTNPMYSFTTTDLSTHVDSEGITDAMAGMLLYPNPTSQNFTVRLEKEQMRKISVIDTQGRTVLELVPQNVGQSISISTEAFSSGTYYVLVFSKERTYVKRLLIQ